MPMEGAWWRENGQEFAAALEQELRGKPDKQQERADEPPTMILIEVIEAQK